MARMSVLVSRPAGWLDQGMHTMKYWSKNEWRSKKKKKIRCARKFIRELICYISRADTWKNYRGVYLATSVDNYLHIGTQRDDAYYRFPVMSVGMYIETSLISLITVCIQHNHRDTHADRHRYARKSCGNRNKEFPTNARNQVKTHNFKCWFSMQQGVILHN